MDLLTILLVSAGVSYDEYRPILASVLSSGAGTLEFIELTKSIVKKTNLNLELDKLKDELKMGESQEIKRR